jgi:hypothetical protein
MDAQRMTKKSTYLKGINHMQPCSSQLEFDIGFVANKTGDKNPSIKIGTKTM